jgi:undecaprenyl phosphate-alpha-L-ara4N flippase subunit ArnF
VSAGTADRLGVACLGASILLSACGQLAMKAGMQALRAAGGWPGSAAAFAAPELRAALAWTVAGLAAYGASLLCWLVVLSRFRLSHAYPLLALSYVLVYVGATQWSLLHEGPSAARTAGTLLIVCGVALVSLGRDRS